MKLACGKGQGAIMYRAEEQQAAQKQRAADRTQKSRRVGTGHTSRTILCRSRWGDLQETGPAMKRDENKTLVSADGWGKRHHLLLSKV